MVSKKKRNESVDLPTTTNYYFEDFTLTTLNKALKNAGVTKLQAQITSTWSYLNTYAPVLKRDLWYFLIEFHMVKILQKTGKKPL
jgi:hypothetical protein